MFTKLKYALQEAGWDFARKVSELREESRGPDGRKLRQADVAQRLALSLAGFSRLEKGKLPAHQLSVHQVDLLRQALIDSADFANSDEDLAHLLGAYAKECLSNFESRALAGKTPPNAKALSIPVPIMVDLWITSNDLAANPSDTASAQALQRTFQRALKTETHKANVFVSNPYRDILLADEVNETTLRLHKEFNVITAGPRPSEDVLEQLESCWACVMISSPSPTDSGDWRAQIELAASLKIPVIGLFTDPALLNGEEKDNYFAAIVLDDPDQAGDKLRNFLKNLVGLRGQAEWWRRLASDTAVEPWGENERVYGVPQGLGALFVGRQTEIDRLTSLLRSSGTGRRAVNLFGWSVGKTALACQVLNGLTATEQGIDVIYPPGDAGIDDLYQWMARVPGGSIPLTLKTWLSSGLKPQDRGKYLLERMGKRRTIILLDGFERHLDADGQVREPELSAFLQEFLTHDHNCFLVITSRQRLALDVELARHVYPFPLHSGLSTPDGVTMLHELDSDGVLAHTDAALLKSLVEKAQGFPAALFLICALLTNPYDRVSPEELLQDEALLYDTLINDLVKTVQARLTPNAQRVMQALSVLARPGLHLPITSAALTALLADSVPNLREALDQLVAFSCIKWDHDTDTFEIHAWDQRFYYGQISLDSTAADHVRLLEHRAAAYYDQAMSAYHDVAERRAFQWTELDHWLSAGDYTSALVLLDQMSMDPLGRWDHDYLVQEGYFSRLVSLRSEIAERLPENASAAQNLCKLGLIYLSVGQYPEAGRSFEAALLIAQKIGNQSLQSHCLCGIGDCERTQQYQAQAEDAYRQALSLLDRVDDRYTRVLCLDGLASLKRDQGDFQGALNYAWQALTVAQAIGEESARFVETICLETQARIYRHLVLSEEAQKLHQQALVIQQALNDHPGELYVLNRLGMVSQDLGEWAVEEAYQQKALDIAERIGELRGQSKALERLGFLQIVRGRYDAARQYIERAFSLASSINARRIVGYCHFRFGQIYLAGGAFEASLDEFFQARHIFDSTQNRFDQQDCWNQLAKLNLILTPDQPDRSLEAVQNALACKVEFYNHHSLLLKTLALLYKHPQETAETREAFVAALAAAEQILVKTPRFYAARFTRALALAGMVLLSDRNKLETDLERAARIACSDLYHYRDFKGETAEVRRLLKLIRTFDPDGRLAPLETDLIKAVDN